MRQSEQNRKQGDFSSPETLFISYAREDTDWAKWTTSVLDGAGHNTILDVRDFRPGSNFVLEIDKALRRCDRVFALLSPAYLFSQYAQAEWASAFARDPSGADRRLIPVRVRDCVLEGLLPQIEYVDLVGVDEEEAAERLLAALREEGTRETEHAPFPVGSSSATDSLGACKAGAFPTQVHEEGLLDLVERGVANLHGGSVASMSFAALVRELGDNAREHAREFRALSSIRGNQLVRYKQTAQRAAKSMKVFADLAEPELRAMAFGWEPGLAAWRRATDMLDEFPDVDVDVLRGNFEAVDALVLSIPRTRQSIDELRDTIRRLPPLEGRFIFGRNAAVHVLDAAVRLLDRTQQLAEETRSAATRALARSDAPEFS